MKAFAIIFIIFVTVVIVVFQTGYYSHSETPKPVKETIKQEPVKRKSIQISKKPETKIVYVPQVIEKVYVREIIRTERVVYSEPNQPVSNNSESTDSGCSSFTGEARTNCERTVRNGGTARQYQASITYYGGIR